MTGATKADSAATAKGQPCRCGRVDVHAHFLPEPYQTALANAGLARLDGGIPVPTWSAESHLAMMDRLGIASSMLSISSPGLHFLDAAVASGVARACNEAGAALTQAHPGKFGFFAVLPLPDISASLAEMAYAFDHLNADGVVLETNARGTYLGDPLFDPLFDELDRRNAVLFLHPTSPECLEQIGMGYPGPLLEFPFDTARTAVSLIFSGVLRRRPNIRLILSHGGGALPILVSRIAMISQVPFISPRPQNGAAEVLEEVRRLYFDLALAANPITLNALLHITDISHILFGTDFPFAPPPAIDGNTASFAKLIDGLSADQRRMVEYKNATTLFPRLRQFIRAGGE